MCMCVYRGPIPAMFFPPWPCDPSVAPVRLRSTLERQGKLERRTRCWATILAHLTGFGSIHCGTAPWWNCWRQEM